MTTYEALSLLVSAAAVASIWFGIWQMRRAGDQRTAREDARHAEAMTAFDARHAENMTALHARHTEAMTGLDARHTQAMTAFDARHTEAMRALEGLIRGMETVIERTGGRA